MNKKTLDEKPLLWVWARKIAKIKELEEKVQELDNEQAKLLQVRKNVLVEIESLEERVRMMVRSALSLELPQ